MRKITEIENYINEAFDKVWLMRNCDIYNRIPANEASKTRMERILYMYEDIPKVGYSDWECGYWNGILGTLRWILGEEKNFLDT